MCSRPEPREPLRRVAVIGGTHGNEMSGVYLARSWLRAPGELQRPSFSAVPVLANPAATAACRRYVDCDLNRAFTGAFLTARAHPDDPYEVTRARELNQLLGPKASGQAFDFVLDLHNTTASMGTCLIAESAHNVFAMHLCRHLQLQSPELPCRVFLYQLPGEETASTLWPRADWVGPDGLELGPQPQGVLRADLLVRMRALVAAALDFIQLFNQGTAFPAFEMEAYRNVSSVDFPRTETGDLAGTVHPQLQATPVKGSFDPQRGRDPQIENRWTRGSCFYIWQEEGRRCGARPTPSVAFAFCRAQAAGVPKMGARALASLDRDFEPLRPGAPIFQMFSGKDVHYEGESTVYPVFINEAAYYEKGIAFFQTEKLTFSVPALPGLAPAPSPAP